jgi:hypothetical protein
MTRLAIVAAPAELSPAEALADIVPKLIAAEAEVARLTRLMNAERKRLAQERRVAFVREEHVRREFGR